MANEIIQQRATIEALMRELSPTHIIVETLPSPKQVRQGTIAFIIQKNEFKSMYLLNNGQWIKII